MFITPEKMGISQEEKSRILDRLWSEEKSSNCPDCGVLPGQQHQDGCDVDRCPDCKIQKLQCNCGSDKHDTWTGLWPGVKECQELELICWDTATNSWMYDLNKWVLNQMRKKKSNYK